MNGTQCYSGLKTGDLGVSFTRRFFIKQKKLRRGSPHTQSPSENVSISVLLPNLLKHIAFLISLEHHQNLFF